MPAPWLDAGGAPAPLPEASSTAAAAPPSEPPGGWFVVAEDAGKTGSCRFGGVVASVETTAAAVAPGETKRFRAVRVTFAGDAAGCHAAELTGVRVSGDHGPIAARWRDAPCSRIVLGVPRGWTLPFGQGTGVCGSVRRYSLGYDSGSEVVVLDTRGNLLLAFADAMPRTPSPLPGWIFALGPERSSHPADEGYALVNHDVEIARGGARWVVRADAPPERREGGGGAVFRVEARGYRISGLLPVWMKWLQDSGYGFALAREEPR